MTKSWVIGRHSDCDLVVDIEGVSSHHCTLRHDGDFAIEDLGSTNGTYVDGVKIKEPTKVTTKNVITLGREIPMPWPGTIDRDTMVREVLPDSVLKEGESYSIGRFDDNDIVLAREMVSGHHAELSIVDGKMYLEDAGSTNGTAVSQAENLINGKVEVAENDLVFFGSFSIKVTHLLAAAKRNRRATSSAQTSPPASVKPVDNAARTRPNALPLVVAAAAVILLFGGVWMLLKSSKKADDQALVDLSPTNDTLPVQESNTAPTRSDGDGIAKLLASLDQEPSNAKPLTTDAANALFLITNQNESGDLVFHTGTAWLGTKRLLITTAEVIEAVQAQESGGFPVTKAIQSSSGRVFDISDLGFDQRYLDAKARHEKGREEFGLLSDEIKQLGQDASKNEGRIQKLELRKSEIIRQGLRTTADRASFNVGWLRLNDVVDSDPVEISVDHHVGVRQRVHLHAIPFSRRDHIVDSQVELRPHGLASIVADHVESSDSSVPNRSIVLAKLGHSELDYRGSPLLSLDGKVIGMFTHRVIGNDDGTDSNPGGLFEAISAASVLQVLEAYGK